MNRAEIENLLDRLVEATNAANTAAINAASCRTYYDWHKANKTKEDFYDTYQNVADTLEEAFKYNKSIK